MAPSIYQGLVDSREYVVEIIHAMIGIYRGPFIELALVLYHVYLLQLGRTAVIEAAVR